MVPDSPKPSTELLYMAAIYRRRQYHDLAIKLLNELIEFEERSGIPDKTCLSLGLYNLAEVYSDQGNDFKARPLYARAAELWHSQWGRDPLSILWYSESLQGLQVETERLTELARDHEQKRKHAA